MSRKSKERRKKQQIRRNDSRFNAMNEAVDTANAVSTNGCIDPNDYTLEELSEMPTELLTDMLLNHADGYLADFAYPYSVMMEAYDLIDAYKLLRNQCITNLTSDFDKMGSGNNGSFESLFNDSRFYTAILKNTETETFKEMKNYARRAPVMLIKLERAIEILEHSFANHPDMDEEQKDRLRNTMNEAKSDLVREFEFIISTSKEATDDD